MLTSIHPLGERARNNPWWLTVAAFTGAAIATGATVGGLLGGIGSTILPDAASGSLVVMGVSALGATALDLGGVARPTPHRQVNERWIGAFRGWVYGGAFGAQLGAGVATYVVTWLVFATFVNELVSGSILAGAAIGAAFGLGRAVPLLAARWIDRPSRLMEMSEIMARIGRPALTWLAVIAGALGAAGVVAGTA